MMLVIGVDREMTNLERKCVYKVWDYIKLINPTNEHLRLHRRKGEIGIISYIHTGEIYVIFFTGSPCNLLVSVTEDNIELYKNRNIESILLAYQITKNSLRKSITKDIEEYINDNFDKKLPL